MSNPIARRYEFDRLLWNGLLRFVDPERMRNTHHLTREDYEQLGKPESILVFVLSEPEISPDRPCQSDTPPHGRARPGVTAP